MFDLNWSYRSLNFSDDRNFLCKKWWKWAKKASISLFGFFLASDKSGRNVLYLFALFFTTSIRHIFLSHFKVIATKLLLQHLNAKFPLHLCLASQKNDNTILNAKTERLIIAKWVSSDDLIFPFTANIVFKISSGKQLFFSFWGLLSWVNLLVYSWINK
jgi:hypothetical protein